jgi:hypothetical protein
MEGGSYQRALAGTFVPELASMNFLMAGMLPTMMVLKRHIPSAGDPATPEFWFVMSMALLVGLFVAYPINWWLVVNHLKHGMMTVRPASTAAEAPERSMEAAMSGAPRAPPRTSHASMPMNERKPAQTATPPRPPVPVMLALSFLALAAGVAVALAQPM